MSEFWNKLVEGGKTATDVIKSLYNVLAQLALYVTIVLAAALVVYHIVVSKRSEEEVPRRANWKSALSSVTVSA